MNNHNAIIEKLKSYRETKKECERLKLRMEEICSDLYGLRGTDYSKTSVKSFSKSYAVETAIERKAKIEEKLSIALQKKYEVEDEVKAMIYLLDDKDNARGILIDRYIELLPMREIMKKYAYTYDSLKMKFSRAYAKLNKILKTA